MPKHKRPVTATAIRRAKLEQERKALEVTLKRTRVVSAPGKAAKRARTVQANYWPDLSCDKPGLAPTSDRAAYAPTKVKPKIAVPDGYIIGHSHKQGMSLFPKREAEWAGGKKS